MVIFSYFEKLREILNMHFKDDPVSDRQAKQYLIIYCLKPLPGSSKFGPVFWSSLFRRGPVEYNYPTTTAFSSKVISPIIINVNRCVQVVVTFQGMPSLLTPNKHTPLPPHQKKKERKKKKKRKKKEKSIFKTVEGTTKIRIYSGF